MTCIRSRNVFLTGVFTVACACGGGEQSGSDITAPPAQVTDPGALNLVLDAAPADLGAIVVTIAARDIGSFTPAGYGWSSSGVGGASATLMLRGNLTVGLLGQFRVGDRNAAYSAIVTQAAARRSGGYRSLNTAGVALRLTKP